MEGRNMKVWEDVNELSAQVVDRVLRLLQD